MHFVKAFRTCYTAKANAARAKFEIALAHRRKCGAVSMMVVSKPASTAIPANAWDCPQGIIGDHAISKLAISAAVVGAVVIATRFVWSIPQLIFRAGSFPHSSAGIGETEAHGQLRARSFRKGARSFFQSLLWPCL
jgi:hypothetical protein